MIRMRADWKTPSEAICVVAAASSADHFANAAGSATLMHAPSSCWRNGANPMPHGFASSRG